jgi:hypothetical protein
VTQGAVIRQSSSRRRGPGVRGTLGVSTPTRKQRKETLVEHQQQYVGIDLHRRRSVIVRMNDAGEVLAVSKIENDPLALSTALASGLPVPLARDLDQDPGRIVVVVGGFVLEM